MSDLRDIAEQSTLICIGAVSLVTGAATGIAAVAPPLAILAAVGIGRRGRNLSACTTTAIDTVFAQLSASRDFRADDVACARTALKDARGRIAVDPPALHETRKREEAGLARSLAEDLAGATGFKTDEEGARARAIFALEAALKCLLRQDEIDRDLTQTLLFELFRENGMVLTKLDTLLAGQDEMKAMLVQLLTERGGAQKARASGITDAALVELARRISSSVTDADTAFREPENAVEVAIRVQAEGAAGSNLGDVVDEVLRRAAALSAQGAYDEAGDAIDAALAREEAESAARQSRLLTSGIEAATLARRPERVAALLVRRLDLDAPPRPLRRPPHPLARVVRTRPRQGSRLRPQGRHRPRPPRPRPRAERGPSAAPPATASASHCGPSADASPAPPG